MKGVSLSLLGVGLLLALSGVVFTLQGFGVVGPPTSFMYQNSQWIYGGSATLVIGVIIFASGL
ncbi:MAG: hypothetical protein HYU03_06635, partial [Thaumarchaeota archaeon]|nr:hypothetical protein [Nitrososphaerota archaeon]